MAPDTLDSSLPAALGEQTGKQDGSSELAHAVADVLGMPTELKGYLPAPAGTPKTYRQMRANPTVALARAVATMPIRTAEVSYESAQDTPEEREQFVKDVLDPLWPRFLRDALFALDYGNAAFEKVWELDGARLVYGKLKPLLPDMTKILVDEHGRFGGLRQQDVTLPVSQAFLFTHDGEAGNLYGRSRHENIRSTWAQYEQALAKEGQYVTKVSGVIPMVEYPEGESRDRSGATRSNFELAQRVLTSLGRGDGVAMPNTLAKFAQDLVRSGADISKLKSWIISFLETKGSHGAELTGILRHKESLILRGWLVPERAATEGQFGTKAEAGSHGDLAVDVAGLVLDDLLMHANRYLINPLLVVNFGAEAKDSVRLTNSGLSHEQRAFVREVVKAVLTQPMNIDLFLRLLNVDALLDQTGLPKGDSEVSDQDIADAMRGVAENGVPPDVANQAASFLANLRRKAKRG